MAVYRRLLLRFGALMAECLWNDEYLIGPRIFCFAAGWVAPYVDVSPFRIEGTKDVSGLARRRFSRWKDGFGGRGSERRGRKDPHDRLRTKGDLSITTARASAPTSRATKAGTPTP